MAKVLIVNPVIRAEDDPRHVPYGLALLAGVANREGHEIQVFDANGWRPTDEELIEAIKADEWDVIATGGNSAGIGGDGHFTGNLIDLNIAIYAPINIAVAGPNSTADAHQTNNVQLDQSAIQIAGVGGDGGHGNAALGGDIAMHVLADHHLLAHA